MNAQFTTPQGPPRDEFERLNQKYPTSMNTKAKMVNIAPQNNYFHGAAIPYTSGEIIDEMGQKRS